MSRYVISRCPRRTRLPESAAHSLRRDGILSFRIAEPARRRNGAEQASTMLPRTICAIEPDKAKTLANGFGVQAKPPCAPPSAAAAARPPSPFLGRTGGLPPSGEGRGVVNHAGAAWPSPKRGTIWPRPFGGRLRSSSLSGRKPRLAFCHPTILLFRSRS